MQKIEDAILQKHLLFAFGDTSIQNIFTVNSMSSSLWDAPGGASLRGGINDFIGISEANLGVNKANYAISRKINQDVSIDKEGSISAQLTIVYKNSSQVDYKNYLRIILPFGSKISSLAFDDEVKTMIPAIIDPIVYEAKNFISPKNVEVERQEELGKTIYGFLAVVPPAATKKITVSYVLPQKTSIDKESPSFIYDIRIFKQPGTDTYPYSFSLSYPSIFRIISASSGFVQKEKKVSYIKVLSKDEDLHISFGKK